MSFTAVYPEIFPMHATLLLLIHGVVFSTSTNYDYPPSARNVGWLGFTIVASWWKLVKKGADAQYRRVKDLKPCIRPNMLNGTLAFSSGFIRIAHSDAGCYTDHGE